MENNSIELADVATIKNRVSAIQNLLNIMSVKGQYASTSRRAPKICFTAGGPSTSEGVVNLPLTFIVTKDYDRAETHAMLAHEMGHQFFTPIYGLTSIYDKQNYDTEFNDLYKDHINSRYLHEFLNVAEDVRVDTLSDVTLPNSSLLMEYTIMKTVDKNYIDQTLNADSVRLSGVCFIFEAYKRICSNTMLQRKLADGIKCLKKEIYSRVEFATNFDRNTIDSAYDECVNEAQKLIDYLHANINSEIWELTDTFKLTNSICSFYKNFLNPFDEMKQNQNGQDQSDNNQNDDQNQSSSDSNQNQTSKEEKSGKGASSEQNQKEAKQSDKTDDQNSTNQGSEDSKQQDKSDNPDKENQMNNAGKQSKQSSDKGNDHSKNDGNESQDNRENDASKDSNSQSQNDSQDGKSTSDSSQNTEDGNSSNAASDTPIKTVEDCFKESEQVKEQVQQSNDVELIEVIKNLEEGIRASITSNFEEKRTDGIKTIDYSISRRPNDVSPDSIKQLLKKAAEQSKGITGTFRRFYDIAYWEKLKLKAANQNNLLQGKLKQVLKAYKPKYFSAPAKAGFRLNRNQIHNIASGVQVNRPFSKREKGIDLSTEIVFLSDVSTSMQGKKADNVNETLIVLLEALQKVGNNIKVNLAVFGNTVETVKLSNQSYDCYKRIPKPSGCTAGYEAVYYAVDLLSKSKANRKIIICLTDGIFDQVSIKPDFQAIHKAGIETYGIGYFDTKGDMVRLAKNDCLPMFDLWFEVNDNLQEFYLKFISELLKVAPR